MISVDRLDRGYRIVGPLGEGSAGIVYEAEHVETKQPVALKVYHADVLDRVRGRFWREVELLRAVRHRRLVRILDWGPFRDSVALAMERLSGPTLGRFMPSAPTEWVMWLLADAAEALSVLHDRGVVHRDIKPDNILVRNDGPELEAVLLDLGIARAMSSEARLTQPGTSLGTPTYMSPEQSMTSEASYGSDVWSMGVLMYQALAGRVPFVGRTPLETVLSARREPPPPLVEVPEPLAKLVLACLEKDPRNRPASGGDLFGRLVDVLRAPSVQATLAQLGPARARAEVPAPTLPDVVGST